MLSRLVITFPPRSKCLLISWLQSPSAVILEPRKIKSATVFPSIFNEIMGLDVMIFVFWMLSLSQYFHSSLSLSSRGSLVLHFLPQDWCYLHIWGYWYFSQQSISLAFLMMYSAYKLNKQGDNIQPWHTPFPIWNQSLVLCLVLTVASWPTYRFLRRQVWWSGISICFRIFHRFLWSTQSKALA